MHEKMTGFLDSSGFKVIQVIVIPLVIAYFTFVINSTNDRINELREEIIVLRSEQNDFFKSAGTLEKLDEKVDDIKADGLSQLTALIQRVVELERRSYRTE